MAESTKTPGISDEMRRFIEEEEKIELLRAEGKLPPPDPHLQAKMDSGSGSAGPGEETPWQKYRREHPEESEDGGEDAEP